jgi:hypothetical protein
MAKTEFNGQNKAAQDLLMTPKQTLWKEYAGWDLMAAVDPKQSVIFPNHIYRCSVLSEIHPL